MLKRGQDRQLLQASLCLCVDTGSLEGLSWVTSCQLVFPGRHQAKIKDNEGWARADLENELVVVIRGRMGEMDS